MSKITPTLVICSVAALVAAGLLALPPAARTAAPTGTSGPPASVVTADEPAVTVAAPATADLVIEAFAFGPTTVTVAAGGTINVVNRDTAEHTVTADDGTFDVFVDGGSGSAFTAPATPGTYTFFCRIHPAMTAVLIVT